MQRYAYTTRYTYTMILRNDSKNFTAQYVAHKRNNCGYICFTVVNVIIGTIKMGHTKRSICIDEIDSSYIFDSPITKFK